VGNFINTEWLFTELEIPNQGPAQPDMAGGQPPMSNPDIPGNPMGNQPPSTPPQGGPDPSSEEDVSTDPQYPDMPDQQESPDFESWKIQFFKDSIKGDPNVLEDQIQMIRDKDLGDYQRKFVEDNLQICFLRQHQDILIPSTKIRKLVKQELDRNAPATTLVTHITNVLEEHPLLSEIYLKLSGTRGGKGDNHRKFLGGLLGAIQVGSGAANEDLHFEDTDYSIRISTRLNAKWGDVSLGPWMLKEDDAQRYLKEPELKRLEGGSPEEKDVLRRRIVMESIAEMFKQRAFIINVVGVDGTIQHLGLDLGNCLQSAYIDGRLVVRTKDNDNREAFIDEEGSIIPIPEMSIYYVKEGEMGESGTPDIEEFEFMAHRNGTLFLTAMADLIKEASSALQGVVFVETPWQGNPSDLMRITRCSPSVPEILLRRDC
jgi:hypothetical protein